ncbi:MAG: diguanylate cyclase, partial [Hyphomicrobiales bacterium]
MWQVLIANLAVVSLFISVWAHAQHFLEMRSKRYRQTLFALFMGAGAVATMSLSVELQPGIYFDLRSPLVAMAGFFTGPLGGLIAATMAGGYRLTMGGAGTLPGIVNIVLAAGCGAALHWLGRNHRQHAMLHLLVLSVAVAVITTAGFALLPPDVLAHVFEGFLPILATLIFASTFLSGFALLRGRIIATERRLLRAAVTQAPDYLYVKDRRSRFVAVNRGVAEINGFSRPADLQGRTDFSLTTIEHAQRLYDAEQQIMATGVPVIELEEQLPDAAGQVRWFSTSKSPLRDADGNVIGIAGVTRDITERRRLEKLASQNHSLISFALTEMSDGLAMFDKDGYLVLCNRRYSESFPLTSHVRQPGAHLRTILEAVVKTGEQLGVPRDNPGVWIGGLVDALKVDGATEVTFADGRWLQIRTRPTSEGSSLVVVTDVTTIKHAELALLGMTDQLKELAATDGLTGLLNRRTFDVVLDSELSRTLRERQPLSLLMIDVDRFKAYNDHYGHPAGDKCLRLVANCLREAALRPGDSLARYGGEEFAAILPNTDEDGAYVIAERLRKSLRELALPHEGSEKG